MVRSPDGASEELPQPTVADRAERINRNAAYFIAVILSALTGVRLSGRRWRWIDDAWFRRRH